MRSFEKRDLFLLYPCTIINLSARIFKPFVYRISNSDTVIPTMVAYSRDKDADAFVWFRSKTWG